MTKRTYSIEKINGRECTVVWHRKPWVEDFDWEQSHIGFQAWHLGDDMSMEHIATALPPLPRYPEPEDAPLLYRYMAEGIDICGEACVDADRMVFTGFSGWWIVKYIMEYNFPCEITHATDKDGTRVEIAIQESPND